MPISSLLRRPTRSYWWGKKSSLPVSRPSPVNEQQRFGNSPFRYVLSAVSIPRFQRLNKLNRMHCPIGPQKGTRTTTSISIMGMKRLGVRYPDMSTRKSHSVPFPIVVWPMIHRWKKRISWSLSPSLRYLSGDEEFCSLLVLFLLAFDYPTSFCASPTYYIQIRIRIKAGQWLGKLPPSYWGWFRLVGFWCSFPGPSHRSSPFLGLNPNSRMDRIKEGSLLIEPGVGVRRNLEHSE